MFAEGYQNVSAIKTLHLLLKVTVFFVVYDVDRKGKRLIQKSTCNLYIFLSLDYVMSISELSPARTCR